MGAMTHGAWERVPIDAQSVEAPLLRAAVFLVMEAGEGDGDLARIRDVLGAIGDLVKNVGFRDLGGRLSCVVGIGSARGIACRRAVARRTCVRSRRSTDRCTPHRRRPGTCSSTSAPSART
jgi:hypothetical protein